ncbi:hypothetical protein GQ464_009255 [Rhodocaloribacter litoris]|uniref:hypothetical protein n=1 Tax=Rhodocaloribacter litoris TaxID=2558931 RepID=UPI00141F48A4|nr:hypothetical protein [Rhodocaloribacter litoris]QXD17094.1 hypothetical protein GQ464_009255 [Rhodocaloribacter litoris]GIV60112.1 MAG: hypothetical protein KatS3mg043_1201 [Rhodothermaceae bacterium]
MDAEDRSPADAAVLRTMVLLASFSTAAEVWKDMIERRAGRDPAAQEAAGIVRPFLWDAARGVDAILLQLQGRLACLPAPDEPRLPGLVRRFEDLMALRRLARLLHLVHQRLMSLYPAVSETLVERARVLQRSAEALLEAGTPFEDTLAGFLPEAFRFTARLRAELAERG